VNVAFCPAVKISDTARIRAVAENTGHVFRPQARHGERLLRAWLQTWLRKATGCGQAQDEQHGDQTDYADHRGAEDEQCASTRHGCDPAVSCYRRARSETRKFPNKLCQAAELPNCFRGQSSPTCAQRRPDLLVSRVSRHAQVFTTWEAPPRAITRVSPIQVPWLRGAWFGPARRTR